MLENPTWWQIVLIFLAVLCLVFLMAADSSLPKLVRGIFRKGG
jgi:hypothetical protein